MRQIWIAFLMMLPCLFAQGGQKCQDVGGAVLTNFLPEPGTITIYPSGKLVSFTGIALGTLTGDLKGGVVIYLLNSGGTQGNMVTESGDTIYVDEALATTGDTIPGSAVSAAFFPKGLEITGGTGRFAGARGNLDILFGASDNDLFIFRYQGKICFAQPED